MAKYLKHLKTVATQRDRIPGTARNDGGGFSFPVDDWTRLDRFLILGSEGGTFYASERQLTRANADAVERLVRADGLKVVGRVVAVSDAGRAPRNDPALFVLAAAAGLGDDEMRAAALAALPKVARIGTHLFHFAAFVEHYRGWGRGLRRAVARWYTSRSLASLALQAIKYRSRDGWAHRDLLRLAHPVTDEPARRALFDWIVNPDEERAVVAARATFPEVDAMLRLAEVTDPGVAADIIAAHRLPREAVPTELLRHWQVWSALLEDMPATAMIRNLGKLSAVGLLTPGSAAAETVVARLEDQRALARARIHPLAVLMAMKVYGAGRGDRGKLTWVPVAGVVDALDRAFYGTFDAVETTGKRVMLALDVSASMTHPIAGSVLPAREAAAALALVTVATEPKAQVTAFASGKGGWSAGRAGDRRGWASGITPLAISPRQRLDDVVEATSALPFGGTDCALPMLYALDRGLDVDAFVVLTDSET